MEIKEFVLQNRSTDSDFGIEIATFNNWRQMTYKAIRIACCAHLNLSAYWKDVSSSYERANKKTDFAMREREEEREKESYDWKSIIQTNFAR